MTLVTPRVVNNVSCVKRINDECHFSWQAQYLVSLNYDTCCSALVNNVSGVQRINDECYFSWQAQYLVMLERHLFCSAHCN